MHEIRWLLTLKVICKRWQSSLFCRSCLFVFCELQWSVTTLKGPTISQQCYTVVRCSMLKVRLLQWFWVQTKLFVSGSYSILIAFFFFFNKPQGCYCCWLRQEDDEECGCCQHHFPPNGCLHLWPWDEHWCCSPDFAPRRKPGVVRGIKILLGFCMQSKQEYK